MEGGSKMNHADLEGWKEELSEFKTKTGGILCRRDQ